MVIFKAQKTNKILNCVKNELYRKKICKIQILPQSYTCVCKSFSPTVSSFSSFTAPLKLSFVFSYFCFSFKIVTNPS